MLVTSDLQNNHVSSQLYNRNPQIQKQNILDNIQLPKTYYQWDKTVKMKLLKLLTSKDKSEKNIEPTNCYKPSLILRYLDDDIMNWSRQWSCRSSGVNLPFNDLKLTSQDNDRRFKYSALHPIANYFIKSNTLTFK